ncbi:hypothetical protein FT643_13510 [Ketobacter sp. MCCC 1A13808]|uniref:hypothetical protein n=1 Tax=Ketobacter sp. MCCC 1A13808 TaxID=2602738 RepID=UPI0012EBC876|nr:hypothetical protein [Ketobacter sp. MCCC 1A13808]MVF13153.1 hypothetical protein [Ketobacter sp. MCCC 1A13808]
MKFLGGVPVPLFRFPIRLFFVLMAWASANVSVASYSAPDINPAGAANAASANPSASPEAAHAMSPAGSPEAAESADSLKSVRPNSTWSAPDLPGGRESLQVRWSPLSIQRQDLLFANYQRNGSSAEILDPTTGYQLKLFALKTNATTNYNDVVFTHTPGETNYGATMSYDVSGPLQVSAGYIGEREEQEELFPGYQPTGYGSNSWNMAADTRWLGKSITSHWEYARSEYTANRFEASDVVADQAMQAQLRFSSDGVFGSGWMDYWAGQFHYRSVGQHFYSAGNGDLAKGRDLARFHFQTAAMGVGMEFEWQQECDNKELEPISLAPVIERSGVRLNYNLSNLTQRNHFWKNLGSPSVTARYFRAGKQEQQQLIVNRGYEIVDVADEVGLNLLFTYTDWHWSLDYQVTDEDLRLQALPYVQQTYDKPSDQLHHATEFQLGWLPTNRLSLNLNAQWYQRSELEVDHTFQNQNYGIEANIDMVPNKLSVLMKYNYGYQFMEQNQFDYRELDNRSYFGNAQVSWHAAKKVGRRPAVDVYLKSSYGRQQDRVQAFANDQWSAHLGVELYWAKKDN